MKKHLILTSVLALAACGGGSGNAPLDARTAAIINNKQITGMNSFVVVGGNNPTINTNARIATLNDGGQEYDLSDVVFRSSDKEFGDEDEDFRVSLMTNAAGEIVALNTVDDGEHEIIKKRPGETNKFGRDYDSGDGFDYASLKLFGDSKGMQYSDFGFIEIYGTDDSEKPMFIVPIAGGYEVKTIAPDMANMEQDIVFNGTAIGNVGEPDTTVEGDRLTLRDDTATLTFSKTTGDQVLQANFDNWYDIVATKYSDGDAQIAFSNGNNIANDKFRFKVAAAPVNSFDTGKIENNTAENKLSVGFDYYGDTATKPAEATGIIFYQQQENDNMPLLMGFGGTLEK